MGIINLQCSFYISIQFIFLLFFVLFFCSHFGHHHYNPFSLHGESGVKQLPLLIFVIHKSKGFRLRSYSHLSPPHIYIFWSSTPHPPPHSPEIQVRALNGISSFPINQSTNCFIRYLHVHLHFHS